CGSAFGACKGALTKKRVYRAPSLTDIDVHRCASPSACADYGAWYDGATGNRTHEMRPSIMAATAYDGNAQTASGDLRIKRYNFLDGFSLFATLVYNEYAHTYSYTIDHGTGLQLSRLGPEYRWGQVCDASGNNCRYDNVWDQATFIYDGLGRLTEEDQA